MCQMWRFSSNCKKCHFIDGNVSNPECQECSDGYYLDSNKECSKCEYKYIGGTYCYTCSSGIPDLKTENCYCGPGYFLRETSCQECPAHCNKCEFQIKTDSATIKCLRCEAGYILNNGQIVSNVSNMSVIIVI